MSPFPAVLASPSRVSSPSPSPRFFRSRAVPRRVESNATAHLEVAVDGRGPRARLEGSRATGLGGRVKGSEGSPRPGGMEVEETWPWRCVGCVVSVVQKHRPTRSCKRNKPLHVGRFDLVLQGFSFRVGLHGLNPTEHTKCTENTENINELASCKSWQLHLVQEQFTNFLHIGICR